MLLARKNKELQTELTKKGQHNIGGKFKRNMMGGTDCDDKDLCDLRSIKYIHKVFTRERQ